MARIYRDSSASAVLSAGIKEVHHHVAWIFDVS